ncbi:gluconate transporter [Bordetella genomosp. 10]|uniref:Gluconate transporter n=1 Tax=Bordetella genomosp. 10 TaxID=1416804 RepID=A0A261SMP2_9BORD|nr:gluconate:H+ symporter [Bordetella genomosp. 10]OZI38242.1 gluconate transporter [Bordetella genomosp. 10]
MNPTTELNPHDIQVLVVAAAGIALLVLLIVWLKLHAFLALTIGSLFVGVGSGIPLEKVTTSYENGVGGVLGYVGVLIALGAMLGKLLADSGGADIVVDRMLRGRPATLPWKMALVASIIGIPMFFEIGLVLLIPVVMLAVHRSKGPAMRLGIPALAGLSVLHGFIPPHPGPLAAIAILHADVGLTLGLGLLIAIPTVIVGGPVFGKLAARMVPVGAAGAAYAVTASDKAVAAAEADDPKPTRQPSFGATLLTLLSPIILMLAKAASDIWLDKASPLRHLFDFIGDPVFALLFAVLLAMITFGTAVGFTVPVLAKKIGNSLMPVVGVMLIVGAGGGFKQSLVDGGAGQAIAKIALATGMSVLVLAWIVAVLIRLATGSATVATVTAAGIIEKLAVGMPQTHLSLVVLAIGAGSVFFSHVNDAGFWLVKEYFGLTIGQTIKSWSLMETVLAVMGLILTYGLWQVV